MILALSLCLLGCCGISSASSVGEATLKWHVQMIPPFLQVSQGEESVRVAKEVPSSLLFQASDCT